jgi:hypothetical protein
VIVTQVVLPLLSATEQAFGHALNQINLDDMVRYAELSNGTGRDEAAEAPEAKAAAMRAQCRFAFDPESV